MFVFAVNHNFIVSVHKVTKKYWTTNQFLLSKKKKHSYEFNLIDQISTKRGQTHM